MAYPRMYLPTNDTFTEPSLGKQWQWNHNADAACWSLFDNPGSLRLYTASVTDDFMQARNTLTQRIFSYNAEGTPSGNYRDSYGTARFDLSGMSEGDVCGLGVFQDPYGYVGVRMTDGQRRLVFYRSAYDKDGGIVEAEETVGDVLDGDIVYLRAVVNFGTAKARILTVGRGCIVASTKSRWALKSTPSYWVEISS